MNAKEFNNEILTNLKDKVDNISVMKDIVSICKESNKQANEEYLKEYPTHRDLLNIFENAVTVLESCMINTYLPQIAESVMTDIEFIIGQNVLIESHIQRMLLSPMTLQELPIFTKKLEDMRPILTNLYNCENNRYGYNYNEEKANLPFNYQQVDSYLKYNKVGFEEELVNNRNNGDYVPKNMVINTDKQNVLAIHEAVISAYDNITDLSIIDLFKLQEHGFDPVTVKHYEGKDYFIHFIKENYYNLYKSKNLENTYYMFTRLPNTHMKSYKLSIKDFPVIEEITTIAMLETMNFNNKRMW